MTVWIKVHTVEIRIRDQENFNHKDFVWVRQNSEHSKRNHKKVPQSSPQVNMFKPKTTKKILLKLDLKQRF